MHKSPRETVQRGTKKDGRQVTIYTIDGGFFEKLNWWFCYFYCGVLGFKSSRTFELFPENFLGPDPARSAGFP